MKKLGLGVSDWLNFVRTRTDELSPFVFCERVWIQYPIDTIALARMTYAAYHKELNKLGFGRDESGLPQLQPLAMLELLWEEKGLT